MKKYNKKAAKFFEIESNPEIENFISINLDISMQIAHHLESIGWSQKEFAKKLGKSESEISKWLSGMHNLTLKSISKMQAVLGHEIIVTPEKAEVLYHKISYVTFNVYATSNKRRINPSYTQSGKLYKKVI